MQIAQLTAVAVLALQLFAAQANASANPTCYQNEIDPKTKRIYANNGQYQADLDHISGLEPEFPGLVNAGRGYLVYKEVSSSQKFRGDKHAHCIMGCRIAAKVGEKTATYAAWYKEVEDLTDCNRHTMFEWQDIKATEKGIIAARLMTSADEPGAFCRQQCR